jgi:uncharacterized damage-inducible protein DinB
VLTVGGRRAAASHAGGISYNQKTLSRCPTGRFPILQKRRSTNTMTDVTEEFLVKSCSLLVSEYLPKIERCLEHLTDEDVWWRPNDASNSIGNLMLHLRGNVTQWIIGGVGGQARERRRQEEFDERTHVPAKELLANLRAVVQEAGEVIRGLDADALLSRRQIQDYDVTVLEAIYHVVEHFSMHTGQIILLTKARRGEDLKLWRPVRETTPGRQ